MSEKYNCDKWNHLSEYKFAVIAIRITLALHHLDHFPACWEEELLPSFPLGRGYLYVGIGPKSRRYSVNLHSEGRKRGPGPADGH